MKTKSRVGVLNLQEMEKMKQIMLQMLHEVGLYIEDPEISRMFKRHGYRMEGQRLKPTPKETMIFIENYATVNSRKTDSTRDELVPKKKIGMGIADVNILDWDTRRRRRGTLEDARKAALFVNELNLVYLLYVAVLPADVHPELAALAAIVEASKYTSKAAAFSGGQQMTPENFKHYLEMGCLVAGGRDAYMKNPAIGLAGVQVASPLKLSKFNTDRTLLTMQFNVLGGSSTAIPMPGFTSMVSLASCVAQSFAETIGGGMFMEMIEREMTGEPHYAFTLVPTITPVDMRHMRETCAAVESTLAHIAIKQMAEFLGFKEVKANYGSGKTESKLWDVQCGYEKMMNTMFPLLAGLRWGPKFLGELCTGDYFSFEQAIIDCELIEMGNRVIEGIKVDETTFNLDVFKSGINEGMFTALEHTLEHYREELYLPQLASREFYEKWDSDGRISIEEKAHEKVMEIMARAKPEPKYPPDLLKEMDKLLERFRKDFE